MMTQNTQDTNKNEQLAKILKFKRAYLSFYPDTNAKTFLNVHANSNEQSINKAILFLHASKLRDFDEVMNITNSTHWDALKVTGPLFVVSTAAVITVTVLASLSGSNALEVFIVVKMLQAFLGLISGLTGLISLSYLHLIDFNNLEYKKVLETFNSCQDNDSSNKQFLN